MKNIVLGIAGIVVTVLGVSFAGKPSVNVTTPAPVVNVAVPEQKTPIVNVQAPNINVPAPVVNIPQPSQIVGSVTGPDSFFDYYNENGSYSYPIGKKIRSGTTTPCSIQTPKNASTTLVRAWFNVTTGTTTYATLTLATSTTAYATTSPFFTPHSGLVGKYSFVYVGTTTASTNGGAGNLDGGGYAVLPPSSFLVFSLAGEPTVGAGGFVIGGTCGALLQGL